MKRIQLIVCEDNGTWDNNTFVEIPDHLHLMQNVDKVAEWVIHNELNKNTRMPALPNISYIGVLDWEADYE